MSVWSSIRSTFSRAMNRIRMMLKRLLQQKEIRTATLPLVSKLVQRFVPAAFAQLVMLVISFLVTEWAQPAGP